MPHSGDMTHWPEIRCQRGHETHMTRTAHVNLSWSHCYLDCPQVPRHLTQMFDIEIWDYAPYMTEGPYCPARDVVSEVIESHGIWEPIETITMLDLFYRFPANLFVDMGAQIGWYSKLAETCGLNVTAFEADPDVAEVLRRNVPDGVVVNGRIGSNLSSWLALKDARRLTVKMDLEGAEPDGVRFVESFLAEGLVDAMLIEISPVFHPGYGDIFNELMSYDLYPFSLPGKSHPPARYKGIADTLRMNAGAIEAVLSGHQENVLFVREGAW